MNNTFQMQLQFHSKLFIDLFKALNPMVPPISLCLVYNLNLDQNCVVNCKSVAVIEAMHKAVIEAIHKVIRETMKKGCDRGYGQGCPYFK